MPRFRSLSTRLTVQFALLFAASMAIVSIALSTLIDARVSHEVESQLVSSGAVYDRLWQQRASELQSASDLLARDFGFRAAVATGDDATIQSALDNMKRRLRVRGAFIIGMDGRAHGLSATAERSEAAALWEPLDSGQRTGIAVLGGKGRQLVASPVLAPNLIGWVVFSADLNEREMRGLEQLSAIPLKAAVLIQRQGQWTSVTGHGPIGNAAAIEAHVGGSSVFDVPFEDEEAFALAKPLPTFAPGERAVLLLAYPKAEALGTARMLQLAVALIAILGLGLVGIATWRAAARITRPLARLDEAAGRLAQGGHVEVEVAGNDELARLGASFNSMVLEIEERERRITHLAFNDVLTNLPNRSMFQQHLDRLLRSVADDGTNVALHCLDLDHFKTINDTMGHPAGDALLVAVANRLSEAARGNFVGRLGGDEFVVIQIVPDDRDSIDRLARALHQAVSQPLKIDGQEFLPSTSIGIAISPADGTESGALLKNADLALYRAKEAGRGTYAFFEEGLNQRAQVRRQLETDLRLALEHGQFELYYQPLFDLETNRIGSFEALLRWNHPTRGLVSPADFIPVAEETGMIVPIGAWAMREACRQAVRWPAHIRVAVNVSSVQFHRPGLNNVVLQALAQGGLAPDRLEIEITESIFLEGSEETLQLLHGLRALGVRIALDDFGTGYSSLSYLQSFPFDKLKIDRSFIQNLLSRPGATAVVRAITELAAALGIETTAEGVEESEQVRELRTQGCSSVQGFLFARPMRAGDVDRLLAEGERDVA